MKLRWLIVIGIVALIALCGSILWPSDNSKVKKAVEETRRALRQQGFKTDLTEFNFFTTEELRARQAALISRRHMVRPMMSLPDELNLMAAVGADSALVLWKEENLQTDSGEDIWTKLRESLSENRETFDAASEAATSGPIRFELDANGGNGILLPHLASLKNLAQTLGGRAVLELHDGDKDSAWKNWFASTRLVTAWQPEPVEISQLVRFACAAIVYNTTWQMLQTNCWTDDQLAALQSEWESADFFSGLPETAAFARASAVATCQQERLQPLGAGPTLSGIFRSPMSVWAELRYYSQQRRYLNHGTYEDEKGLLIHYRDREVELARAIKSATWAEMRQLSGIINPTFQSKHSSRTQTILNLRQINLGFQRQGQGTLGKAATAEIRRRIILTAIALERHRGQSGSYPKTLADISRDLLKNPLTDFADGKTLRYRLNDYGQFVLYSVGVDCVDNGGEMPRRKRRGEPYGLPPNFGNKQELDLVWPRAAWTDEVEVMHKKETKALAERVNRDEEIWASEQWRRTARRQAGAEKLLAEKPSARPEPTYRGQRLSETFQNKNAVGTNNLSLNELLTLRQIVTGDEPETVTFEVPIIYNVLTNLATLQLYIDPIADEYFDEGCKVGMLECNRATNGNCLLVWRTIYESPGKHALQMGLILNDPEKFNEDISGPLAPFVVSNLCQFSLSSAYFNPKIGATLYAKSPESNATYRVEITSATDDHLKTLAGSTSNSVIKVFWDLTDDEGRRCTNSFFNSIFHITLPDSGRSQIMKGP